MPATKCRRCADCEDSEHHWHDNYRFGDGTPYGEAEFICKHCEALGVECSHCYGDGDEPGLDEECSACGGEGVIPLVSLN